MVNNIRIRLSALMFLQYFAWGSWYVTLGTFLSQIGFDGLNIGDVFSASAWAALFSPIFVGMIADRYFSAQRILCILYFCCGGALFWTSTQTHPNTFFSSLLVTMSCYMPTVSLSNSVCFHHLSHPSINFPKIRLFGTIGWIAAGLLVGTLAIENTVYPMWIGVSTLFFLSIYSLFLPETPPRMKEKVTKLKDVFGFEALILFSDRSFLAFALGSILLTIPLAFYYNFGNLFLNEVGVANPAGTMTLGQMSEMIFMLLMPFFFRIFSIKNMLIIGMFAWLIRYVLFANGDLWMLYIGILLHGICYNFFFLTGQIYIDKRVGENLRSSAQGLIGFLTYGIGMLGGAKISGYVVNYYETNVGHNWMMVWLWPAFIVLLVLSLFALLFKERCND